MTYTFETFEGNEAERTAGLVTIMPRAHDLVASGVRREATAVMAKRGVRHWLGVVVCLNVLAGVTSLPAVAQGADDLAALNAQVGKLYGEGKYAEATEIGKRSLALSERKLGPDHPNVGTSLNNLALLYQAQGRYSEAEPLYKRSLALSEKALGPDHPHLGS